MTRRPPRVVESPWAPWAAIWSTLFLGPLAGALVTAANLLRLGRRDKALFALITGLGSLALLGSLWATGRVAGEQGLPAYLLLAGGDIGLFLYLQWPDYQGWAARHSRDEVVSSALAAIWALIGFALMLGGLLCWLTTLTLLALARGTL